MATIIRDPRELPPARTSIPNLKPPIHVFSSQDFENPEEADEFIAFVRSMRNPVVGDENRRNFR
jgi:hypothetical protein